MTTDGVRCFGEVDFVLKVCRRRSSPESFSCCCCVPGCRLSNTDTCLESPRARITESSIPDTARKTVGVLGDAGLTDTAKEAWGVCRIRDGWCEQWWCLAILAMAGVGLVSLFCNSWQKPSSTLACNCISVRCRFASKSLTACFAAATLCCRSHVASQVGHPFHRTKYSVRAPLPRLARMLSTSY